MVSAPAIRSHAFTSATSSHTGVYSGIGYGTTATVFLAMPNGSLMSVAE